ncbi:MAG: hypothetical protein ACKVUS_03475 [Saprospiraceae bacterium]
MPEEKKADFFLAGAGQSQQVVEAGGREAGEQGLEFGVESEGFFEREFLDEFDVGRGVTDFPEHRLLFQFTA